MRGIKVDTWSHCGECWEHYGYFNSVEEANHHIAIKGYNPAYFRVDA